jgi:hypothetical protein
MQRKRSATIAIGQKRGVNVAKKVVQTRLGESPLPMSRLCVTDGGLNSRVILTCAELRTTSVLSAGKNSKRHQIIASSVARKWTWVQIVLR